MAEVTIYNAQQTYDIIVSNLIDMLEQQNYSFSSDELRAVTLEDREPINVDLVKQDTREHNRLIIIAASTNTVPGQTVMNELEVLSESVPGAILLLNRNIPNDALTTIQTMRSNLGEGDSFDIQYFLFDDLVFNMNKSNIMHEHRLLSDEEKKEWYKSLQRDGFRIQEDTIPNIFIGDKLQRWYGASAGDVFALSHLSSYYNFASVTLADGSNESLKVHRHVPYYRKVKYPTLNAEEFTYKRMGKAERTTR